MLSSISIIVSLPSSQLHEFSTNLKLFSQTVGYPVGASPYKLLFEKLHMVGDHGGIEVGVSMQTYFGYIY